jgi:hypothetical protein
MNTILELAMPRESARLMLGHKLRSSGLKRRRFEDSVFRAHRRTQVASGDRKDEPQSEMLGAEV